MVTHNLLFFEFASEADVPELVQLINHAYRGVHAQKGWTHETNLLKGERINATQLANEMKRKATVIIKGTDANKQIRACVQLHPQTGKQCYLSLLTVDPDLQNQGIGKQLLLQAEQYARSQYCNCISMTVLTDRTELLNWYLRHGYQSTGIKKPFPLDTTAGTPMKPLTFTVLQKIV